MKQFNDDRGSIYDFENGTQIITSKAGAKRANHFHKTSGHRTILTRGAMDYYEKVTGEPNSTIEKIRIEAPAIFDTIHMIDHLMHFTEDSEFVCVRVGGSENQEEYENDVVRLDYDMEKEYQNKN